MPDSGAEIASAFLHILINNMRRAKGGTDFESRFWARNRVRVSGDVAETEAPFCMLKSVVEFAPTFRPASHAFPRRALGFCSAVSYIPWRGNGIEPRPAFPPNINQPVTVSTNVRVRFQPHFLAPWPVASCAATYASNTAM